MACCGRKTKGTRSDPIIMGTDEGGDPIEVRALVNLGEARRGKRVWARGSLVETAIEAGWLVRIVG